MKLWENLKMVLRARIKDHRTILLGLAISGVMAVLWDQRGGQSSGPAQSPMAPPAVDTYIPRGYTLVPIDVQNLESLDSVFGNHGIVDLYAVHPEKGSELVAQQVKMLRAPKNPGVFAVLVRAERAQELTRRPGPFFVIVHSRSSLTGDIRAQPKPKRSSKVLEEI